MAEHSVKDAEYIEGWRNSSRVKKVKEAAGLILETGVLGKAMRAGIKARRPQV